MATGDRLIEQAEFEEMKREVQQEMALEDLARAIREAGKNIAESIAALADAVDRGNGYA
jgi:chaperonin GroEL (HSP60 family)